MLLSDMVSFQIRKLFVHVLLWSVNIYRSNALWLIVTFDFWPESRSKELVVISMKDHINIRRLLWQLLSDMEHVVARKHLTCFFLPVAGALSLSELLLLT